MIIPNIIHPEKRGKISSKTFHVFYLDNQLAVLFDKYLDIPIIYGSKTIVNGVLRKFNDHIQYPDSKIRIFFYKPIPEFKFKFKFEGLASKIVVPNF